MFDVPPDLRERKWRIQPIEQVVPLALSKLFLFSTSEQFDMFMLGVTTIQANLNHQGELSLYEGEDRVRFSTWTMEKENDTIDPITETDLRLARQIETFYTNLMKDGTPKPALFLDFDGTVRDVVEDPARAHKGGFRAPYRPEEVEVYPQVSDILEMWDEEGYFLVGATNQSGVGRGDLTEASAVECIEETVNQIGIGFPVFYSTSKKAANYKPRIGMGLEAIEEHGPFDLDESIMVGDNHRGGDENFAYNLGIKFIHADDFFHLSKDQRKGRAAESFTTLNSEFFSEFAFIVC
jgi:HAD superfamily hydrolase (TIGR01662 family)